MNREELEKKAKDAMAATGDTLGFGYAGVVTMLVILYSLNFLNALTLCSKKERVA